MKKRVENLKISSKLILGFLFVSFLGIIVGVVGIVALTSLNQNQQNTYDQCTLGVERSSKAQNEMSELGTDVRDLYIYFNFSKSTYLSKVSSQLDTLDAQVESYGETISDSTDQANYDALESVYDTYKSAIQNIIDTASSEDGTQMDIYQLIDGQKEAAQNTAAAFQTLEEYNTTLAAENLASCKASALTMTYILAGVAVLSIVISLLLSFFLSRIVSDPLKKFAAFGEMLAVGDLNINKVLTEKDKELKNRKDEIGTLAQAFHNIIVSTTEQSRQTKEIADGDLTVDVTVRAENDVLGNALSDLVGKLEDLIATILSSADQVNSGAKMVADSSTALSQGAEEQASSVQELTASIEEITTQTTQNAENAEKANELAKTAEKNAGVGNAQMKEMLKAMDEINVSSNNINSIIKVIEDIAFQTNILALNAAVEAARAGQYGKGFAVVAEEVRNLAARSAKAASETTALIEGSIKKVESGTKIAEATSAALQNIVAEVEKTAALVGAIAQASHEQATAIEQINQGVSQVSQVVQTNAATSEESAAASEELSAQASQLIEFVNVFKINKSRISTAAAAAKERAESAVSSAEKPAAVKKQKAKIALSDSEFGKY